MRKFMLFAAIIMALSVMSFAPITPPIKHTITVVNNKDAGKPFIATCSGVNYSGGWQYQIWETFVYASYVTQGCTGIHTESVQYCEVCAIGNRVCGSCSGGPSIIEPATYEQHTITIDKMTDAKAYGNQLFKDYPNAHDINMEVKNGTAIITFRVFIE